MVFCSLGTVPATGRGRLCAFWKCLGIKFGSRAHGWGAVSRTDQLCKSDSIFILHKYASVALFCKWMCSENDMLFLI